MEKRKMKKSVLILMIIALIIMGVANLYLAKIGYTEFNIIIADIVYAIIVGLLLRRFNVK